MAMREDEDVAEAMGIHTLKYKLLAFAIGTLLIVMMIVRPEGIWPSTRRRMELYEHKERPSEGVTGPPTGV